MVFQTEMALFQIERALVKYCVCVVFQIEMALFQIERALVKYCVCGVSD